MSHSQRDISDNENTLVPCINIDEYSKKKYEFPSSAMGGVKCNVNV